MANIQKSPSHTLPPDQLGRFAPSLSVPPHFSEAADALASITTVRPVDHI